MSPTDALWISCGSNFQPPAPALIMWTFGSIESVEKGDADVTDDISEAVGVDDCAEAGVRS
jgi:hypothetical protein